MIEISVRTRARWRAARIWPIMPPIDAPMMCALASPSASSRPTASAAMSDSRYGASIGRRSSDRTTARPSDGATARSSRDDSPTSRLSNRTTKWPASASARWNGSGQRVSCAPSPMISSTGGAPRSPVVSTSSLIPLASICMLALVLPAVLVLAALAPGAPVGLEPAQLDPPDLARDRLGQRRELELADPLVRRQPLAHEREDLEPQRARRLVARRERDERLGHRGAHR